MEIILTCLYMSVCLYFYTEIVHLYIPVSRHRCFMIGIIIFLN